MASLSNAGEGFQFYEQELLEVNYGRWSIFFLLMKFLTDERGCRRRYFWNCKHRSVQGQSQSPKNGCEIVEFK